MQIDFLWSLVYIEKRCYIAYVLNQMSSTFKHNFLKKGKKDKVTVGTIRIIKDDVMCHYKEDDVIPSSIHYNYLYSPIFFKEWSWVISQKKVLSTTENQIVHALTLSNIQFTVDKMKKKLFSM